MLCLQRATCAFASAGALLISSSCGSSSETVTAPSQPRCVLQVQAESLAYPPAGGSGTIRVTTNRECAWSAQSDARWVSLSSPATGQGEGAVHFTVAANADPSSRNAGVSVNDQRVPVSQEGRPCEFRLSSVHEAVDAAGGDRAIQVDPSSAQCGWTAVPDVPWIAITSGNTSTGPGVVRFHVTPTDGASRTGTIRVAGQVVTVAQGQGCSYSVEPSQYVAPAGGGPGALAVRTATGCAWSAGSTADWITVTAGAAGSGPGEVRFTVAASNGPGRAAAIRVADQSAIVNQGSGCTLSLNPSIVSAGAQAVVHTVQVGAAAGCAWSASSGAPWITIAGAGNGVGTGQVQIAVAANAGSARTASVTIGDRTVAIAQASGCTYGITPASHDVGGAGGSAAVSIATAAGCSWTATANADWIVIPAPSGAGPGQLSFTARPNAGEPRAAAFAIAGQTVVVNQASQCSYHFSPPSHAFDASGGGGNVLVIVSGACTWTAVSGADWIRITAGAAGAGNGLVQFAVTANAGPARTGIIRIAGQNYTVTQGSR